MEREVMGIYISGHPLLEFKEELKGLAACAELTAADGSGAYADNQRIRTGGVITSVRTKPVKNGSGLMAYAVLEDLTGSIELAVFPSVFARFSGRLAVDNKVIVSGRLNMREDQANTVLADEIMPLEKAPAQCLYLRLNLEDGKLFERVKILLERFPGNLPVVLYDGATKRKMRAPKELFINPSEAFLNVMREMLGEDNVRLK